MAYDTTELREGIGEIFVDAMRRHNAITAEMWLVARAETRRAQQNARRGVTGERAPRSEAKRLARRARQAAAKRAKRAAEKLARGCTAVRRRCLPDDLRVAILRLRGERCTYSQIADALRVGESTIAKAIREDSHQREAA